MMRASLMEQGAVCYTPLTLKLYDLWVLGISNRFAWQCPTRKILLPFFCERIGKKHLDVGVGTGFYLSRSAHLAEEITLLDLNLSSLTKASRILSGKKVHCLHQSILQPLPLKADSFFDSISLFYLLHCMSGTFKEKEAAIVNLKHYLSPQGVLYGATILGASDNVRHNLFGRLLMSFYNNKGIFSNRQDTLDGLKQMLVPHFRHVQLEQQGQVALFSCSSPIV